MRKFTKLMLTLALLVVGVGGAKATKTKWSPSGYLDWVGTWTSATNTFAWSYNSNHYYIINPNFPSGDLSSYTKIRATISSISGDAASDENGKYIQLKITSTDKADKFIKLYEGVNNVLFSDYDTDVDFTKVGEISVWGTLSPDEEGRSGSAVITEMYLYNPVKTITVATGFGDEITSLDGITDGTKFVIANADASKAMYFVSGNNSTNSVLSSIPNDSYYFYTLSKVEDSGLEADNIYRIFVSNSSGTGYSGVGSGSYLNTPNSGWSISFSGYSEKEGKNHVYGTDADNLGLWYVTYDGEKGFSFQNVGKATNGESWPSWLKVDGLDGTQQYLKLYKSITFESSTDLDKEDNAANDAIFALADATGYNAETGILKDGGWTFATTVDLSDWDYLVITVENTSRSTDTYIKITDNSGKYVQTSQYNPENASIGPQMYFGTYNNHNIACFSMDYLRINKDLDISNISSLELTGEGLKISSVYLTDYAHPSLATRDRWNYYVAGDVVRSYDSEGVGKFGTICLPYVASCAGAEVYSIEGKVGNSLTLNKVTGLLEAGKPYFYKASDVTGKDADVHNVNFFRADLEKFDAASAGTDNGLIGTFSSTKAPLNSYVLSRNKLYQVDKADAVTVDANKAYVDLTAITTPSLARGNVFIDFDEPTGIKTVKGSEEMSKESVFFDLQGRRVAQPVKGMYIVNGKKVMVK